MLRDLLKEFEKGLNPGIFENSSLRPRILGYGEISTVFTLDQAPQYAVKRMPLFSSETEVGQYAAIYNEYCSKLAMAGLNLPESRLETVHITGHPAVLYIIQEKYESDRFAHRLIHELSESESKAVIEGICREINRVWKYNTDNTGEELAIDGQLSNWIIEDKNILYVDTSTPLYRVNGQEQLNPELILNTAPAFLRWILRLFFLDDVMERYYDPRNVFIDLVANLYKEQRPDLVPAALNTINTHLQEGLDTITEKDVKSYYREDRVIWALFLAFRKLDRWITTRILRKRYEFILPGKIRR